MSQEFKEISDRLYKQAHENAYSRESMAGHDAAGKKLNYIGSRIMKKNRIFDFYRDESGGWWYETRVGVSGIGIISMEEYIFGSKKPTGKKGIRNERRLQQAKELSDRRQQK